ncbi:four-carbon acid sugar kinase family protein [Nonomuraea sp. NPDC050643]|uniref:four-carbon acid sugar kinase family protein n=1 Tax=Nonomuraea sp. NPDC050643 TaxID=3155660 RepID=UPI0033F2AAFB
MTIFAFVADDFTGATDALWQFRRFGFTGSLVTDVAHLHDRDDVIGLATTARAEADPAAVVLPALRALAALSPLVVQYKICSTFDSSPARGSIGSVIAALHREGLTGDRPVPVLAAQPEFGRYTWFANHFVRAGDEMLRLDRYPPMRDHPSTPATEADLRVRLAEQGAGRIGWLPPGAAYPEEGDAAFVADATTEDHLRALGALLLTEARRRGPLYCVGSGGLTYALASALTPHPQTPTPHPTQTTPTAPFDPTAPLSPDASPTSVTPLGSGAPRGPAVPLGQSVLPGSGVPRGPAVPLGQGASLGSGTPPGPAVPLSQGASRGPVASSGPIVSSSLAALSGPVASSGSVASGSGGLLGGGAVLGAAVPVLVVCGSRSPITARQIDTAERAGWRVLDVSEEVGAQVEASLREGRHTIVQSTRGPARDPADIGESLGRVAAAAVRAGLVGRLVVAGGDTSGQVVAELGARSLDVIGTLAVGGPVCVLASDDPACDGLEVALKGGQVGGDDYFLRAAAGTPAHPRT